MKVITFYRKADPPVLCKGYLYEFMGLRLVIFKPYYNSHWWYVAEYSTGCGLAAAAETRNHAVANARSCLDRQGSLRICQAVNQVIQESGLLNF